MCDHVSRNKESSIINKEFAAHAYCVASRLLENKREAHIKNTAWLHDVDLEGNVMYSVAIIARWTAELLRGVPLNNSLQRRIKGVRGCFRNDHLPDLAQSLRFLRRISLRQNAAEQIWLLLFVHEPFPTQFTFRYLHCRFLFLLIEI